MTVHLGRANEGKVFGYLLLQSKQLDLAAYAPNRVRVVTQNASLGEEIFEPAEGFLRQVKVPDGLADISKVNNYLYVVRLYEAGQVNGKQGLYYTVTGQPVFQYTVGHPDVVDNPNVTPTSFNRLRIARHEGGVLVNRFDYEWDKAAKLWTLVTSEGDGGFVRSEGILNYKFADNERLETYAVMDDQWSVLYIENRGYHQFPWGEERTSTVIDPGGAHLETITSYYDNPAEPWRYKKLRSESRADGDWIAYDYDPAGRKSLEIRSWLDTALTEVPAAARATSFDYTLQYPAEQQGWHTEPDKARVVTEAVLGTPVRKTCYGYWRTSNDEKVEVVEQCADPSATACVGAAGNLVTTTTYYPDTGGLTVESGRVHTTTSSQGTGEVYEYAKGTYTPGSGGTPGTFAPGSLASPHLRTIVTETPSVEYQSTRRITVADSAGLTLMEATEVLGASSTYHVVDWTVYAHDGHGHVTDTWRSNNTHTEASWGCCTLLSETDESGIITTYDDYDTAGRVKQKTRAELGAAGTYLPQLAQVTQYAYDSAGRQLSQTTSSGGESLSTSTQYDRAGRLETSTDATGLTTGYVYETAPAGGRRLKVTRPGGAEEITEYYRDGRIKSLTGSGVVHRFYEYGAGAGTEWTKIHVGPQLANSPQWTTTTTDGLGRTATQARPAFGGGTVVTTFEYDDEGRLWRVTAPGMAPTLTVYDDLGNIYRTGLDVDADGELDPAAPDRVQETETRYEMAEGGWWRVIASTTYGTDASGEPSDEPLTVEQWEKLTGLASSEIQRAKSKDLVHGLVTTSYTTLDVGQVVTRTVEYPDSDTPEQTVTRNGLVQSVRTRTGLTRVYTHDSLGRQLTVTDARGSVTTTGYYPTATGGTGQSGGPGQVARVTDPAGKVTTYGYETTTGRLTSIINPDGETQFFAYSARGEQEKVWGTATYPVWTEYDDFGRRWKLHTYRTDAGFGTDTWPTSAGDGDVTTRVYEQATGLLAHKRYADYTEQNGRQVSYTYTAAGKLATRIWARTTGTPSAALVTTYDYYDDTGEPLSGQLQSITYTDETPTVTFEYDRLGRHRRITDAVGERLFKYDGLDLHSESINPSGTPPQGGYSRVITRNYEEATFGVSGRLAGFQIGIVEWLNQDYDVTYGYDAQGRLNSVMEPTWLPYGAFYDRLRSVQDQIVSDRVGRLSYKDWEGTTIASTTWTLADPRELVTAVENQAGSPLATVSKHEYAYDSAGRRTSVKMTGSAFGQSGGDHHWRWQYNDRSELTMADRCTGTDLQTACIHVTPGPADHDYAYDPIGNRTSFTLDSSTTTYTPNPLNQYDSTANPNEYFCYDADGNLVQDGKATAACQTQDGSYVYTWDAENRLKSVAPVNPQNWSEKASFTYDYMGRRTRKLVQFYYGGQWHQSSWAADFKFVYEGWNLILTLVGGGVSGVYVWGLDLSGQAGSYTAAGLGGAGGIGGLLAGWTIDADYPIGGWYFYDGNGNVGQVVDGSRMEAAFEYDPYGKALRASTDSWEFPFRFSTKWLDNELPEAELYYYGYRYYSSKLGRWLSRDPARERGGWNLLAALRNSPTNRIDWLGLWNPDMHGDATLRMAREAGYRHDCAEALSAGNLGQDVSHQFDFPRHFMTNELGIPDGGSSQARYLLREAAIRDDNLNKAHKTGQRHYCMLALESFGRMLHTFQDSFSHIDGTFVAGNAELDHHASTPLRHITGPNLGNPHRPDRKDLFEQDWKAAQAATLTSLAGDLGRWSGCPCRCERNP